MARLFCPEQSFPSPRYKGKAHLISYCPISQQLWVEKTSPIPAGIPHKAKQEDVSEGQGCLLLWIWVFHQFTCYKWAFRNMSNCYTVESASFSAGYVQKIFPSLYDERSVRLQKKLDFPCSLLVVIQRPLRVRMSRNEQSQKRAETCRYPFSPLRYHESYQKPEQEK